MPCAPGSQFNPQLQICIQSNGTHEKCIWMTRLSFYYSTFFQCKIIVQLPKFQFVIVAKVSRRAPAVVIVNKEPVVNHYLHHQFQFISNPAVSGMSNWYSSQYTSPTFAQSHPLQKHLTWIPNALEVANLCALARLAALKAPVASKPVAARVLLRNVLLVVSLFVLAV